MDGYDDDNDLDNLVENRGLEHDEAEEDNGRQQWDDGEKTAAEAKAVPVKIRVKKPQPKLDPAR